MKALDTICAEQTCKDLIRPLNCHVLPR